MRKCGRRRRGLWEMLWLLEHLAVLKTHIVIFITYGRQKGHSQVEPKEVCWNIWSQLFATNIWSPSLLFTNIHHCTEPVTLSWCGWRAPWRSTSSCAQEWQRLALLRPQTFAQGLSLNQTLVWSFGKNYTEREKATKEWTGNNSLSCFLETGFVALVN